MTVYRTELSARYGKGYRFCHQRKSKGGLFIPSLVPVQEGKPTITVMLSEGLVERGLNAGQLVRNAKALQGGGGGQPNFATAGG